jgi:hypothetical protein
VGGPAEPFRQHERDVGDDRGGQPLVPVETAL